MRLQATLAQVLAENGQLQRHINHLIRSMLKRLQSAVPSASPPPQPSLQEGSAQAKSSTSVSTHAATSSPSPSSSPSNCSPTQIPSQLLPAQPQLQSWLQVVPRSHRSHYLPLSQLQKRHHPSATTESLVHIHKRLMLLSQPSSIRPFPWRMLQMLHPLNSAVMLSFPQPTHQGAPAHLM